MEFCLCSRLGDAGIYRDRATMPIVSIDRDIDGFSTGDLR